VFYLYLCRRYSQSAPVSILAPTSSPLHPWVFGTLWTAQHWCVQGICGRKRWRALSDVEIYFSPVTIPCTSMSVWAISCVVWCCAICNRVNTAFLLSSTVALLLSTRITTYDPGVRAGCFGRDVGSIYYLGAYIVKSPEHHRRLALTFRPEGAMFDDPRYHDLQALAVPWAVLPPLRPHVPTECLSPLAAISAQDIRVDIGAFSCNLRCLGHAWKRWPIS